MIPDPGTSRAQEAPDPPRELRPLQDLRHRRSLPGDHLDASRGRRRARLHADVAGMGQGSPAAESAASRAASSARTRRHQQRPRRRLDRARESSRRPRRAPARPPRRRSAPRSGRGSRGRAPAPARCAGRRRPRAPAARPRSRRRSAITTSKPRRSRHSCAASGTLVRHVDAFPGRVEARGLGGRTAQRDARPRPRTASR